MRLTLPLVQITAYSFNNGIVVVEEAALVLDLVFRARMVEARNVNAIN